MDFDITRLGNIGSWRLLTRPIRRFLLLLFAVCLVFYLSNSLYNHIVDLYIPSLTIPIKRDMSSLPILKDQVSFIRPIIRPLPRKDRVFLLVLVSSGASGEVHVQKRMAIRQTWGKPTGGEKQFSVTFFLGKTHELSIDSERLKEAAKYRDMIIGDFPDTYRNITKKLLMAFKWASEQNYDYLLKTDDDVYINIPSLIQWIRDRPFPETPLYAGVLYRADIVRDKTHRHYVSWRDLPQKRYPWYPKGALYVLSGYVVREMLEITSKVKQITVDDAYIGVLASYLGVQPVQMPGFIQWAFLPNLIEYFDKCTYMNIIGMGDNLSPKDIHFVHQEVISLQNSSKWMCIQAPYPLLFLGIVMLVLMILSCFIRK